VDFFKTKRWKVDISPYYIDLITGKSREINIIAQQKWSVVEQFRRRRADILIRLFIECKYILPTVSLYFNFIDNDRNLAESLARNNNILRKDDYSLVQNMSKDPPRIHHYLQESEVAKSCACVGARGNKDIFFGAWEQALHALLYFRDQSSQQRFAPVDEDFKSDPLYIIDYPIVVINSFDTSFKRDLNFKAPIPITNNFLWSVDYSYTVVSRNQQQFHKRNDFFIDITSFPTLEEFLANLERSDIEIFKDTVWYDLRR
jgi:hypothetical protein